MAVPVDPKLRELLKQFVCVRAVQMWGLDLDKYQFDGFLTWAVFFLNADGTIYGRYGSRSESGHDAASDKLISVEGFSKTLQRALVLHDDYTKNPDKVAQTLAGKIGPKRTWKRAQDIPEMEKMFRTKGRFGSGGNRHCIHCHMVPRAEVASLHSLKRPLADQYFWPFPLPQEIGFEMDPKEVATVSSVQDNSIAASADLRTGDIIRSINGQPILSMADVQWVLHHAKSPDTLEMVIDRGGQSQRVRLLLDADWRNRLGDWRYNNSSPAATASLRASATS